MNDKTLFALAVTACLTVVQAAFPTSAAAQQKDLLRTVSEERLVGFAFPESVGCDPRENLLYVSQFGSALKPTQKDGAGYISKMTVSGRMIEEKFLPAPGQILNKPKGIWIQAGRLWVTDIDAVWEFDLATRKGRKVSLPGIQFANDPTVQGNVLYVSDNRGDQLFAVEPADFLAAKRAPKVTRVFAGKGVNPNGLYASHDGSVIMVGFKSADDPRGIFSLMGGEPKALSEPIGRLDGVVELEDGSLLVTDWNSGSLFRWSKPTGMETLATGFKGPADICVAPRDGYLQVAVPDLVKSEVRLVRLRR